MRPNGKAASDTLSEISEASTSGTERSSCYSSDYRDELHDLATSLGLNGVDDLYRDRFRVDRKRLESMLLGNSESANSAHEFFQKIMRETKTLILWPSRLKIGAKSKKDPHIKIAGLKSDVNMAKEKVMAVLDTRSGRVTMKLDVSYTDHSHIIGKGGLRIKRVMEETKCHIHFPDSNRNNQEEKSNQVSIAGQLEAIEKARFRVRELTPLIFCFELPNVGTLQSFPELTSPYIVSVQESYNVQVMFRTRAKLHSTLVMVKGCEWEVARVKEATIHLINHMCDRFANQVSVQMMMEISPQYHSLVLGAGHQNLKAIMQHTGVQVMFPDPSDPHTPSLKKSSVTITGSIHNVYLARQMIIGSLPLVLMFDLMPDAISVNAGFVDELMVSLDVYISIRHRPKQNIFSVIIKGLERNAGNIYEARRRLTGSRDPQVVADIPASYFAPGTVPTFLKSFSGSSIQIDVHGNSVTAVGCSFPTVNGANRAPFSPRGPSLFSELAIGLTPTNSPRSIPSDQVSAAAAAAIILQQKFGQRFVNGDARQLLGQYSYSSFSLPDTKDYPPYSSLSSNTSSLSSPAASPRTASPSQGILNENKTDLIDLPERKAPGFERSMANVTGNDYQQLRVQATQVMQTTPTRAEMRIPTSNWSGHYFSHSSPSLFQEMKTEENNNTEDNRTADDTNASECSSLSASNYLDSASSSTFNVVTSSNYTDLPSQLASLGLQKYIHLFKSHEIDLSTFQTLTEADLREIGVTALGARRKMMLFISELKKREQMSVFRGSVAPGAERKSTLTSNIQNDGW